MNNEISSLNLWIHLTDYCNLSCNYCYIDTLNTKKRMSIDVITQLNKKISQVVIKYPHIKTITLKLAGGEPLMQFHYWKNDIAILCDTLNKLDIQLNLRFLTNLTVLNDEIIEFSKKYNVSFAVSIDGLEKYHNQHRKFKNDKGSFKLVKKNLLLLKKFDIFFAVLITVSNDNMDGLIKFVSILLKYNISFRIADAKGENVNRNKLAKVLDKCYEIMNSYPNFDIRYKHLLCDLNTIEESSTPCSMGVNGAAIYINGDIYFCHSQFGTNQALGNIFDQENLINQIQKGFKYHSLSEECKKCEFKKICAGGCPLYRTKENKSPMCNIFKTSIPKIKIKNEF